MGRDELIGMALKQQENAEEGVQVKEENMTAIKHEADRTVFGGDVEFVSRKRVKCTPKEQDKVIDLT